MKELYMNNWVKVGIVFLYITAFSGFIGSAGYIFLGISLINMFGGVFIAIGLVILLMSIVWLNVAQYLYDMYKISEEV